MNVGIIGAGGIARVMAGTINKMDSADVLAIASREIGNAREFALEFGIERAYGSYDELLKDPDIDLVYIAVPHSHHYEWTMKSLEAGKNVLCEKAFAVNEKQAREMTELAESKGLLLTEAIWTRYTPSRKIISDLVKSGMIGEVRTLSANLGYAIDMNERIVRPELAGGALLDLTVYPINFASMVLGDEIESLSGVCVKTGTGVDAQDDVTIRYRDGRMAHLFSTIYTLTDRRGMIYGTEGFIEVDNINNPLSVKVWSNDRHPGPKLLKEIKMPEQITGYEYEVEACRKAIEEGATECPEMPHSETLLIMRELDELRAQFGITYPCE